MDNFAAGNDNVECPICSKEFSASTIEIHASKCLFLNETSVEESRSQNSLKRTIGSCSGGGNSPAAKKPNCKTPLRRISDNPDKTTAKTMSIANNYGDKSPDRPPETIIASESGNKKFGKNDHVPLAERMRPTSLLSFIGQSHVMGKGGILLQLLEKEEIPNIILWGPPGCGKTSLANVIAHICKRSSEGKLRYVKLSAAVAGVADIKATVMQAKNELTLFGRRTVLFMDEIHRFNKTQQDVFLPHIESGIITLIGATTENPSFSLNSALLSRCRVVVLEKLTSANLVDILRRAVASLKGKIHDFADGVVISEDATIVDEDDANSLPTFFIDTRTIEWLSDTCDGDARIALGGLELAVRSIADDRASATISLDDVKEGLKKTHMLYDRKGDQHYDIISALHKSVRASDENASLYWLARMIAGGEDPVYIARRLVRAACEDIGLEDPRALGIAIDTMQGCKMLGMPECDVLLAQCVTYLARAPKSRLMEDALKAAQRLVSEHKGPQPGVPLHLRNAPTKLMKNLGYGRGYNMSHKNASGLNYMPKGLENIDFFGTSDYSDAE